MNCMQVFTGLKQGYLYLSATIRTIRSRKVAVFSVIFLLVFLYMVSSYLLPAHRQFHVSHLLEKTESQTCLDVHLEKWRKMMSDSDAVYQIIPPSRIENKFFPFTGNGNIGFSVDKDGGQFYLFIEKTPVTVAFAPTLAMETIEKVSKKNEALILNIKGGSIVGLKSYMMNKSCIVVEEVFYAHRTHPNLFYHGINIKNDGLLPLTLKFSQQRQQQFQTLRRSYNSQRGEIKFFISQGVLDHPTNSNLLVNVTMGMTDYQSSIKVPQRSQNKVACMTLVTYNIFEKPKKQEKRRRKSSSDIGTRYDNDKIVTEGLKEISNILPDTLFRQHIDSWTDIWKMGVRIDSEKDPDSPSSLHVNLTQYYIYSSMRINRTVVPPLRLDCFSGRPTIHDANLWVIPVAIKALQKLKQKWFHLFMESHCFPRVVDIDLLLMRQTMVFSFLGFQNKGDYVQLALNPVNLQSNISIHSLSLEYFHSKDLLDFEIRVNRQTSERTLHVITNGNHKPMLYGCSTSCDHVVTLGSTILNFPAHTTDPVTPLFYLSSNRTCLELLGKTPFMIKAKEDAKLSHQSHLEVHHFRLSPKFWLAVGILIVSFHLIIIKMIYNECRKNNAGARRRGQFS